ncbi:MAG: TIGR02757 family protein, partial [Flavobacteriales bacterium]
GTLESGIENFRSKFFEIDHLQRTQKHVSSPAKGSSSKRLNMFLRWMVRSDNRGVDFGIWKSISPSALLLPLDVHTGNVSRKLGLLSRKQNDWKAVIEVSNVLKEFDPKDPMKYDFALFGIGVYENF